MDEVRGMRSVQVLNNPPFWVLDSMVWARAQDSGKGTRSGQRHKIRQENKTGLYRTSSKRTDFTGPPTCTDSTGPPITTSYVHRLYGTSYVHRLYGTSYHKLEAVEQDRRPQSVHAQA